MGNEENTGGHFTANGLKGRGVVGTANASANELNYGGYFSAAGQKGVGVYGEVSGSAGYGVYGWAKNTGNVINYGGYFRADGTAGRGVYAHAQFWGVAGEVAGINGRAVYGEATHEGDTANYGGYFVARGKHGRGIYARGGPEGYAAEFKGTTTTQVLEITGGSDLSEGFQLGTHPDAPPTPGMVVVIDREHPGHLAVSTEAYDRRVAGIISGAGSLASGVLMGQSGSAADGHYPVALIGRVYCLADASNGAIRPGDLLTTSHVPGHAMRVSDYVGAQGAILGKAMTALESGRGLVLVLVALQ
jgi:hypothetical protein